MNSCWGSVLGVVGGSAASLSPTQEKRVDSTPASHGDNCNYTQMWPKAPRATVDPGGEPLHSRFAAFCGKMSFCGEGSHTLVF